MPTVKAIAKTSVQKKITEFELFVANNVERMKRDRKNGKIDPWDGNRWFQMIDRWGAVVACQRVIANRQTAYQADLGGPCVEKWVLMKRWRDLFNALDKAIARFRLGLADDGSEDDEVED